MANNGVYNSQAIVIPIGVDRKLIYRIIETAGSDTYLDASCYRRVGTNQ